MTTPTSVITYHNTTQSDTGERDLMWGFEVKDLTADMKNDIGNSFGISIFRDTKVVLLNESQMQCMFLKYRNAFPFTKQYIAHRLYGISYNMPNASKSEASICIGGGGVSVNLYTNKTFLSETDPQKPSYRSACGTDHIYMGFQELTPAQSPVFFKTKMGNLEIGAVPGQRIYYPYVFLTSVPPLVKQDIFSAAAVRSPMTMYGNVGVVSTKSLNGLNRICIADISQPAGKQRVIPHIHLGQVATLSTTARRVIPHNDPTHAIVVNSESQRFTYKIYFDMGAPKSQTVQLANTPALIGSAAPGEDSVGETWDDIGTAVEDTVMAASSDALIGAPLTTTIETPAPAKRPIAAEAPAAETKKAKISAPVPPGMVKSSS